MDRPSVRAGAVVKFDLIRGVALTPQARLKKTQLGLDTAPHARIQPMARQEAVQGIHVTLVVVRRLD